MKRHILGKNETLEQLSTAYGVPVCMIARVNGGFAQGLYAGSEVLIPPRCFCSLFGGRYTTAGEETMLELSLRTGATMRDIMRLNDMGDARLEAGTRIFLPARSRLYTVGATDTLEDISQRTGVSVEELGDLNELCGGVYRGMQLKLPIE